MFDMNNMMGKIKEAQEKMQEAQKKLDHISESAESGGGMVKATVNGHKKVMSIEIDVDIISKDDKKLIEDLTVAAVNLAIDKVDVKAKELMQSSVMGGMPNIPGFDLNNFKF